MSFVARLLTSRASHLYQLQRCFSASADIPGMMEKFKPLITDRMVHDTGVSAVLKLTDTEWTLDLRDDGTIKNGADETADIVLDMNNETFLKLVDGSTTTAAAYMSGQLKLEGNIMQALKLSGLFKSMQGAIKDAS